MEIIQFAMDVFGAGIILYIVLMALYFMVKKLRRR